MVSVGVQTDPLSAGSQAMPDVSSVGSQDVPDASVDSQAMPNTSVGDTLVGRQVMHDTSSELRYSNLTCINTITGHRNALF